MFLDYYGAYKQQQRAKNMKDVQKILEKEHDLLHTEEKRAQYIKNLKSETDFDKTVSNNNKKIKHRMPLKDVLRNLAPLEWGVIICCSLLGGGITAVGTRMIYEEDHWNMGNLNQKHKTSAMVAWGVLGCLVCFCACVGGTKQSDKNNKDIYNRLSVYLFDYLKTIHPELDDSMLHKYNPGLADNITALLIANMDKADTKKLSDIADDLVSKVKSGKIDVKEYNARIDCAMGIIKKALDNNKKLYSSIVLAYKGWATSTFYLDAHSFTNYIYIAGKTR